LLDTVNHQGEVFVEQHHRTLSTQTFFK